MKLANLVAALANGVEADAGLTRGANFQLTLPTAREASICANHSPMQGVIRASAELSKTGQSALRYCGGGRQMSTARLQQTYQDPLISARQMQPPGAASAPATGAHAGRRQAVGDGAQTDGVMRAELDWLAGYIALRFLL